MTVNSQKTIRRNLRYNLLVLLRIHALWFYLSAFPAFILVFSHGSCVTFQGFYPVIDFVGMQLFFAMIVPGLVSPRLLKRAGYLEYYKWAAIINALAQLFSFVVHAYGLINEGAILRHHTTCFQVDFGGIWYTVVSNGGGFILISLQYHLVRKLLRSYS